MKRLLLAALVAGLALPASAAAAAPAHPRVLSVDRHRHVIELVDGRHTVRADRYRGPIPTLPAGARVTFRRTGDTLSAIRALPDHGRRTVSYYGRVISAGSHGLRLRLGDARVVGFSSAQLSHKRSGTRAAHAAVAVSPNAVTVNVVGLQPGVTVLVTQTTDAQGNTTITITLPSSVGGGQQLSGVIADVETTTFTVQTADGSQLVLHMAEASLADLALNECDAVTVSYHQDSGLLIADDVQDAGPTPTGACTAALSTQDATGTISQISSNGLTIAGSSGPMTFTADPSEALTDGFLVGDVVDVTYTTAGSGALIAVDVEYVEQELAGVVTAVSPGAVTITAGAGQPQTITADPIDGMFQGVAVGDELDVTYHLSSVGPVADTAVDQGPPAG